MCLEGRVVSHYLHRCWGLCSRWTPKIDTSAPSQSLWTTWKHWTPRLRKSMLLRPSQDPAAQRLLSATHGATHRATHGALPARPPKPRHQALAHIKYRSPSVVAAAKTPLPPTPTPTPTPPLASLAASQLQLSRGSRAAVVAAWPRLRWQTSHSSAAMHHPGTTPTIPLTPPHVLRRPTTLPHLRTPRPSPPCDRRFKAAEMRNALLKPPCLLGPADLRRRHQLRR